MALFDTRAADYVVDGYWLEDYTIDGLKVKSTVTAETLLVPVKFADAELANQLIIDIYGAQTYGAIGYLDSALAFGIDVDFFNSVAANLTFGFTADFAANTLNAAISELTLNSEITIQATGPTVAFSDLNVNWGLVGDNIKIVAGSSNLFTIAELVALPSRLLLVDTNLLNNFNIEAAAGLPTLDPYRQLNVLAEVRTARVEPQNRIITILSEDRTLIVIGRLS